MKVERFAGAFIGVIGVLAVLSPSFADELELKDGRVLRGRVTEDGDQVTLTGRFGSTRFPKDAIAAIRPEHDADVVYAERRRTADSTEDQRALARWCERKVREGFSRFAPSARRHWRAVVKAEPDDEEARLALGHQRVDGRWMSADDRHRAAGQLRFRGAWREPEEVRSILAKEEAIRKERRARRVARREAVARRRRRNRARAEARAIARRYEAPWRPEYGSYNRGIRYGGYYGGYFGGGTSGASYLPGGFLVVPDIHALGRVYPWDGWGYHRAGWEKAWRSGRLKIEFGGHHGSHR